MAGRSKLQFDLSSMIVLPLLILPSFVGFAAGNQFAVGNANLEGVWVHLLVVVLVYVLAMCWLATRHFDRHSDFRKFPFRGQMLLGVFVGPCFSLQFGLAALAAIVAQMPNALQPENVFLLIVPFVAVVFYATILGVFFGAWLGLLAGGLYCTARWVKESVTGRSTIRPGQSKQLPDRMVLGAERR